MSSLEHRVYCDEQWAQVRPNLRWQMKYEGRLRNVAKCVWEGKSQGQLGGKRGNTRKRRATDYTTRRLRELQWELGVGQGDEREREDI